MPSPTRLLRTLAALLLLSPAIAACRLNAVTAPSFPDGGTRVLFIGNSLTEYNDLPGMFESLARLAGKTDVRAGKITFGNFSLEDHWNEGTARRALSDSRWEFVVMQQGSSALPESQVHLRTWASRFAPMVRASGAEPVLYMVWPYSSRLFDFPNVLQSYQNAAAAINGVFAPAGDAWTAHGDLAATYSFDGLHPTSRGTYLAALVLVERLLGVSPEQLPPTIPGSNVDPNEVRALQRAASKRSTAIQRALPPSVHSDTAPGNAQRVAVGLALRRCVLRRGAFRRYAPRAIGQRLG
jgi:hypothetical protein